MLSKISVVMPVYNEQEHLKESIESILNQTFTDFEFTIIDDGSTDGSADIVESYRDSRIKFYKFEKKGIVKQLNFGIKTSKTQIIARMDADDIAELNRFQEQFDYLQKNPGVSVVGSNVLLIDEKAKVICQKVYPENHEDIEFVMPIENSICHPSVMMRREVFNDFGLYNENYYGAEDYKLYLNLLLLGRKFYNIQKVLLKYRTPVLRKSSMEINQGNILSYKLGIDYLNKYVKVNFSKVEEYKYYYRMALIEYYKGSMVKSRSLFLKYLRISRKNILRVLRYLLISFLGDRIIKHLRSTKLLPYLSLYFNKYLKIDFHQIKPIEVGEK